MSKAGRKRSREDVCDHGLWINVVVQTLSGRVVTVKALPWSVMSTVMRAVWIECYKDVVSFSNYDGVVALVVKDCGDGGVFTAENGVKLHCLVDHVHDRVLHLTEVCMSSTKDGDFDCKSLTVLDPISLERVHDWIGLPCGHVFGSAGIEDWQKQDPKGGRCPTCRAAIPPYWEDLYALPVLNKLAITYQGRKCVMCNRICIGRCQRCDGGDLRDDEYIRVHTRYGRTLEPFDCIGSDNDAADREAQLVIYLDDLLDCDCSAASVPLPILIVTKKRGVQCVYHARDTRLISTAEVKVRIIRGKPYYMYVCPVMRAIK